MSDGCCKRCGCRSPAPCPTNTCSCWSQARWASPASKSPSCAPAYQWRVNEPQMLRQCRNDLKSPKHRWIRHLYIQGLLFQTRLGHKLESKNKKTLPKVIHFLVKWRLRHVISSDWRSCNIMVSACKKKKR